MGRVATALTVLAVAGCASREQAACLLPSQRTMVIAELFFGRDVPNRTPVSDAEWLNFAANVIAASFPDGFTTFDGDGQWRNPRTGSVAREATKILLVAVPPSADLGARLEAVMAAYRQRFDQVSVGLVTEQACASF
jgi:hypothetical protein